jgi:serine/threonine-protein kinase RsbW
MREPLHYVEMKIPAKPEFVGIVRLTISGIANRVGFCLEDIEDWKVAISEAITNTVKHAYQNQDEGIVTIGFCMYEDRLKVIVADQGISFDAKDRILRSPAVGTDSIDNIKEGGFGIFLMEALMDKVEIVNGSGVKVIMTKYLDKNEVDHNDDQYSTTQ